MLGEEKWRLLPTEHVHMTGICAGLAISLKERRHSAWIEHQINIYQNFELRNVSAMLTKCREAHSSNELCADQLEKYQTTIDEDM
jgi:hypothetical protein